MMQFFFFHRMPFIITGNPNGPTMMIGERGADFIKEDHLEMN